MQKILNCLLKRVYFSVGIKSLGRRVNQKTLEIDIKVKNVKKWSPNFLLFFHSSPLISTPILYNAHPPTHGTHTNNGQTLNLAYDLDMYLLLKSMWCCLNNYVFLIYLNNVSEDLGQFWTIFTVHYDRKTLPCGCLYTQVSVCDCQLVLQRTHPPSY